MLADKGSECVYEINPAMHVCIGDKYMNRPLCHINTCVHRLVAYTAMIVNKHTCIHSPTYVYTSLVIMEPRALMPEVV
jgi:hypothetical protein